MLQVDLITASSATPCWLSCQIKNSPSTTGTERSGQTGHWNWTSRSRHSSSPVSYWLPVSFTMTYKLCVLMLLVQIGCRPAYLTKLVTATSQLLSHRGLRSASIQQYNMPRTTLKFGERAFFYSLVQLPGILLLLIYISIGFKKKTT